MKDLSTVTLLAVDCVSVDRLKEPLRRCLDGCSFGAVKILSHLNDTLPGAETVKIRQIRSKGEYSMFMIKEAWRHVQTDHALVFQHDGFILNAQAWKPEWLQYDYIGGPWTRPQFQGRVNKVGNGGFSLRSRRLMEAFNKTEIDPATCPPEDVYICASRYADMVRRGMKYAPESEAIKFSVESGRWEGQFGFHDPRITDTSKAIAV